MVFEFASKGVAVPALVTLAIGGCLYHALQAAPVLPLAAYSDIDDKAVTPGNGPIYRYRGAPVEIERITLLEQLQKAVDGHPNQPFLGRRPVDAAGLAGPFEWQTYSECYKRIQHIASGLLQERMVEPTADGQRFLGIYMKNRPEWVLAQYAAFYAGAAVVPIYDTLGATSTTFILNQTLVATVVCTTAEVDSLLAKASASPTLQHIVLCDVAAVDASLETKAAALNMRVSTLATIETLGAKSLQVPEPITPSSLALLMYTSGTTGDPKGAMITHQNLIAVRQGTYARLEFGRVGAMLNSHPSVLSYMPLAHIAEQNMHVSMVYKAGAIGFYQGDPLKILDDLQALRPTIFSSVPRLLNRIYDKVMEAALGAGGLKRWLFLTALSAKAANLDKGYTTHALYDRLVFGKLKAKLGLDRVDLFFAGAAPLAPPVLSFYRVLLNCMCLEMYGQTEASGAITMTDHRECDAGAVGPPLVTADVKLVSVPDMSYNVTDTTHGDGAMTVGGRGEVCTRGPA
ncbi:Long-chain-fatty-acid--CoA ligase, partial [Achlya hypogyna]